jgi:2-polyprenyl-3-methyl-5-hydroxy-6-metoxy-1,4-benzoquinol methylase
MWMKGFWKKKCAQTKAVTAPEDYWRNLGERVVGNITLDEMINCRQSYTYRAICRIVSDLSVNHVVDLGCNVSILGVMLRENGYNGEYIGVDANPNALTIARKNLLHYPAPFQHTEGNLRKLAFPSDSFECIILKDVLEHMEDFRLVLGEALCITSKYAIIAHLF